MMGMNNPTTSLTSIQKDFPFESRLSLGLLIKFWEDLAKVDSVPGEQARSLLARLREVPALTGPIDDITLLDEHGPLVDALMSAVFPAAFLEKITNVDAVPKPPRAPVLDVALPGETTNRFVPSSLI